MTHVIMGGNRDWISLDPHYISFNIYFQKDFFNKFLGITRGWLRLRNSNQILSDWNNIKIDLIFEILIKNGLLNKFDVDLNITDKKTYFPYSSKEVASRLGRKFKKNENYKEAYYYLTNDRFKNLPKIRFSKYEEKDYFELLRTDQSWYSFYAMDWLGQINFFHHYINHRVLFVTGATGQGKSTQVPKLLMYASKAYDYKNNG
jgi:hypothetical protein